MLTKKTSKRVSGLVRNLFFSYESWKIFGSKIFPRLKLEILLYTKKPSSMRKEEEEISLKDFQNIPKTPFIYFVEGNKHAN